MKLQRVIALVKKEVKMNLREVAVLFMIFLFPIVFVFAFGASFGGAGGGGQPVYQIGLVNMEGADPQESTHLFLTALSNTKIMNIQTYPDNQTAQNDLSEGKVQAVIVVPDTFSQSLESYRATPDDPSQWINATIALHLDKGSLIATQAIPPIIQQILTTFMDPDQKAALTPINLQTSSLVEVRQTSTLDFMAPGMFAFASIFLIMIVAQTFTQDRENGMMKRIRITPTSATEFMMGKVISYSAIALIQAFLVFAMVYLMGFRPNVGIPIYVFSFILILLFSLSNVGFGLITATISKSSGAATGIAFIFVLPQMFLGTFVGASLSTAAQVAGRFVPSYYVTDALTSLFLRGATITSLTILLDAAIVSASCVAILVMGIVLYSKYFKI